MRLVRYGEPDHERAGILDSAGKIRSLAPLVLDWSHEHLSEEWQKVLGAIDIDQLPAVPGTPRLGMPLSAFRQVIAIGLNYSDHADEAGMELPPYPMMFQKSVGSLSGPNDELLLANGATALDWEVELAIVIRKRGRHVRAEDAGDFIGGYCLANDVSERDWQFNFGGQMGKGKSYDSFTPVGPWLLTADEIPHPQDLRLWLSVNGVTRQDASTASMVFGVARIIEHVSRFQTLLPGDLILTGTPAGVGFGMKPQTYLSPGDEIICGVDQLGEQHHRVVNEA